MRIIDIIKNPIIKVLITLAILLVTIVFVTLFALSGITIMVVLIILLAIFLLAFVWLKEMEDFYYKYIKKKTLKPLPIKSQIKPIRRQIRQAERF